MCVFGWQVGYKSCGDPKAIQWLLKREIEGVCGRRLKAGIIVSAGCCDWWTCVNEDPWGRWAPMSGYVNHCALRSAQLGIATGSRYSS